MLFVWLLACSTQTIPTQAQRLSLKKVTGCNALCLIVINARGINFNFGHKAVIYCTKTLPTDITSCLSIWKVLIFLVIITIQKYFEIPRLTKSVFKVYLIKTVHMKAHPFLVSSVPSERCISIWNLLENEQRCARNASYSFYLVYKATLCSI